MDGPARCCTAVSISIPAVALSSAIPCVWFIREQDEYGGGSNRTFLRHVDKRERARWI